MVPDDLPKVVQGFMLAQTADISVIPMTISTHRLSWEMIPTEHLNDVHIWDALLDGKVPLGALIRQLPRLTNLGIVGKLGTRTSEIVDRLTDPRL